MLDETTVEDARDVYAAIRRARPGGLGRSDTQDVAGEPDVTLLEAMRLAADRDGIAREYATAFAVTFERGAPALERARARRLVVERRDRRDLSHAAGARPSTRTSSAGRAWLRPSACRRWRGRRSRPGGVRSAEGRQAVEAMDRAMRDARQLEQPGHDGGPDSGRNLRYAG